MRILQCVVENDELLALERVRQVLDQHRVGLHPSAPLRVLGAGKERSDHHVFEVAVLDVVRVVPLRHVQLASRTLVVLEVGFSSGACRSRSEEHTSELQSRPHLVCRLLLEKKKVEYSCYSASLKEC